MDQEQTPEEYAAMHREYEEQVFGVEPGWDEMPEAEAQDPRRHMTRRLQYLAGLRALRLKMEERMDSLRAKVEATKTWQRFAQQQQDIVDISGAIESTDAQTREDVIDVAAELGIRKPVEGIEVIERTTFQILDETQALEWARDNMRAALIIDKRTFKKLILAMPEDQRPDFIFVGKDPAVRIAGDLTAYENGGDPNEYGPLHPEEEEADNGD